ncbi:elongation factor 1-beta [Saccharolobus solfataricus]|uniref:Elongation factor 1-beta n=3 Tax=Saccharolobus solfataricus TaxID=2287 RepID=EF1B_SACS2|nr:elongation factor 1-beta [Saccharolobus solfataricus]Q64214.3 RecName: Full=Elongation factor 1-beta; Short=EF-1-beta; AltName: Full=aEF-1beta [Saccharolobus solfataricus P2]AAK40523.1 Translation elongation factor EF-1, beta subunit (EF1B) [Saccharolobus solfataricus P2]AKA73501.1 elongation factor 1-beta [Saccharolobus solfataricus]AKA76199.1 elongation factor 1-beta [Saccharolobus solfataricus]AKA78891.1 elongation factor 1-beta [Saccharolobus solfataricus]AZF67970.1 elongation factor 1
MTDVLVVLKVFPDSDEVNLDNLYTDISSKLPKEYKIIRKETEPIAFGLNALILYVQMPEQTEGGTDNLEEVVNNIQGVSHAEVVGITRLGF